MKIKKEGVDLKKRYLATLLIILSFISIFIGASEVTLSAILNGDSHQLYILFVSRIPRLLSVCVTGVGMSICGLIMQQLGDLHLQFKWLMKFQQQFKNNFTKIE